MRGTEEEEEERWWWWYEKRGVDPVQANLGLCTWFRT
jgi:hypothetical protein